MDISELHDECRQIEQIIKSRALRAECYVRMNQYGEPLAVVVSAREAYDEKGYWSSEREFTGETKDAARLIREARDWVAALPSEEDRAIELMIQKLNKLAGELPKGSNDIAQTAWAEIHRMLTAKAETLAKNGLPSPARIQQIA